MKRFMSLKMLALAVFVLSIALAGCVAIDEGEGVPAESDTLKIGALMPLSGDGATYGVILRRVSEMTRDEINAAGGIKGKQLELVFEDGGCNADSANKAIQKLVEVDKVKLVHGGFCSSETLSAAPITEKNKVILFSSAASSPKISQAGDFVFRNYPSDLTQGKVDAEYTAKKGYKKVGIITESQDYTLGIAQAFEEEFKKLGGEVLNETYLSDASDFKSQITKLKGENVDIVFINPQTPPKGDLIFKQLKELDFKGPFLANDVVLGYGDLITKYKEYLEGSIGSEASYDRENPGMKKLQDAYKTKFNEDLQYLSYMAPSYDALYILKEAIEAVGEDTEKIRDYLYAVKDRKGLAGSLTMDKNGDPVAGHVLKIVKDGKVEYYEEAVKEEKKTE